MILKVEDHGARRVCLGHGLVEGESCGSGLTRVRAALLLAGFPAAAADRANHQGKRAHRVRAREARVAFGPRHRFYREARGCGADLFPLLRLASVLRHEMQHGEDDHGEADALSAQARFLRRSMILVSSRRQEALAYVQALEAGIPLARRWDAEGHYPVVELN
jgi:hypothetical protein